MIPPTFAADAHLPTSQLAAKYHRARGTIWGWKQQLKRQGRDALVNEKTASEPTIITIKPEVYRPRSYTGDKQPQTQVLLLSDAHAGSETPTYNPDIFKTRLRTLYDGLTKIRALQARQHPLEELAIFSLGDNIQGENVGIQMALDELGMTVYDQVYKLWVPAMTEFLVNLTSQYRTIHWSGVKGNHGVQRDRRLTSRNNNWDTIAQQSLAMAMSKYPQVEFDIEATDWYKLVEVRGWRYMILHGDVIRTHTQPFSGLERRTADWDILFHPNVFCLGHFHQPGVIRPRITPIVMNGTFKSDDAWAIGAIGKSGPPAQVTFGVHPDRPMSWVYFLELV